MRFLDGAFGVRIARLRRHAKLTQEQLAERAGFAPSSIARLEIGTRLTSLGKLYDLADGLGTTPARLVTDERAAGTEGAELWGRAGRTLASVVLDMADADIELVTQFALRLRE